MTDLHWSWPAVPFVACSTVIVAVALAAALMRGDRVLRLGMIGAAVCGLPWATSQAIAACTNDPAVATHVLRLGQGPVALVGPNLMLLLLGISGQLERYRWVARVAGLVGAADLVLTWTTSWVVPGARQLSSGVFYNTPGPLTGAHISLLGLWLVIGFAIARRASPRGERRRNFRLMVGVFACATIGLVDMLTLYGVWSVYPIAWLPATIAAAIAFYVVVRTDVLRNQGLDRGMVIELGGFAVAIVATAVLARLFGGASAIIDAVLAATAFTAVTAVTWGVARLRPVRVASERELDQFVARVGAIDNAKQVSERLAELWKRAAGLEVREAWWSEGDELVAIGAGSEAGPDRSLTRGNSAARWRLEPEVSAWLVAHGEPLALVDLATMRLGALRGKLEAFGRAHGDASTALVVPLVDREELVGLVEASYVTALREDERGLVLESARAAARALAYTSLARAAGREHETAREVEIAETLRQQAAASRDAELGRWAVAVEYRGASRTDATTLATRGGAGWSAIELADGRLVLLATEAQARGVAAALATAALTGAFAAATAVSASRAADGPTTRGADVTLDDLLGSLQAGAEGVMLGGERVAMFLAILDADAQTIEWGCAGHPGAVVVGPVAAVDSGLPLGSVTGSRPNATALGAGAIRGLSLLPPDSLLVVASTALRGHDDARWYQTLREMTPAGGRLATVLVDAAQRAGALGEDLLAVVVRAR